MPRVPTYRTNETFRAAGAANFGALRQNTSGQEMTRDLGAIGQGVIRQVQENDETNLLSFSNALLQNKQQLLNDPDNGFLGKQGIDAQNGRQQVGQQWQEMTQQAMESLPPRLQARAQQMAQRYSLDFDGDADRHVSAQTSVFRTQVYRDTLATSASEAALNYADPERVAQQAESAAIATRLERRRLGLPEDDAAKEAASSVYQAALVRQAGNDPLGAERRYFDLLEQGRLTGAAATAIDQVLRPIAEDAAATSDADVLNNGGTLVLGGDPAAIDSIIVGLESGGDAAARNPSSSASGAGQFLDSTWLEQVRKNRPDLAAGKSDDEILALKSDGALSRQMVTAYREQNTRQLRAAGVPATAANVYAAHHFGAAGAAAFAKAGADTPMASILDAKSIAANAYLQGKTKGQVLANWQKRGLPVGNDVVDFAGPAQSEAEALQRAQQIADPRRRQTVMAKLRLDWSIRDAQAAAAQQARSQGIREAIASNATSGQSLAALVGAQTYAEIVANGEVDKWQDFRQKVASGSMIQDNPILADTLFRESAMTPDAFKKRDLNGLAGQLSTSTLTTLLERQRTLQKESSSADAAQKDWMSEDDRLNYGFTMLGIGRETDASGDGADKKNAPRNQLRGEFRIAYQNAINTFMQDSGGKKPTPEQANVLLRGAAKSFAQRLQEGRLSAQVEDGKITANKRQPVGLYSRAAQFDMQVTQADRDAVRRAYFAKYGTNPTDAWVTQYIAQKQMKRQPGGAQ